MRFHKKAPQPPPAAPPAARTTPPLEGDELPSYTASSGACGKCGATEASTTYYDASHTCTHYGAGRLVRWGQERLHRVCQVCGYSWDERLPDPGYGDTDICREGL